VAPCVNCALKTWIGRARSLGSNGRSNGGRQITPWCPRSVTAILQVSPDARPAGVAIENSSWTLKAPFRPLSPGAMYYVVIIASNLCTQEQRHGPHVFAMLSPAIIVAAGLSFKEIVIISAIAAHTRPRSMPVDLSACGIGDFD